MRTFFPYTIEGITCYCLNIYAQDQYLGLLTLSDDGSPVTPGKLFLYEFLFRYVRKAAISRGEGNRSSVVTLKTIFSQLLDGVPLSALPMAQALEGTQLRDGRWLCLAATRAEPWRISRENTCAASWRSCFLSAPPSCGRDSW